MNPLNTIGREARAINVDHGFTPPVQADWGDTHKVPAFLGLIHSEVSEALEAFRRADLFNFQEELADIIIRTLDLGYGLAMDMDATVAKKMEENKTRPYTHGGKRL